MKRRLQLEDSTSENSDEESGVDSNLPPRLFATGHFPNRRLNVYSKLDVLTFIHDKLRGTREFKQIRDSCFGKLFDIPLQQCPLSCKLIHALLTRQLVTKQRYVLWTVFGGQPLRFSLEEFGTITGLPCGEFADNYKYEDDPGHGEKVDPYWEELIGEDTETTIADIADLFNTEPDMPSGRKLRLALIMIVDGVLVATHQVHRPTLKYVRMVKNVKKFLQFPWGRESFLKTIACMKPGSVIRSKSVPKNQEDPVSVFVKQMLQKSFRLRGFPIVLQLLAYRAIPSLLAKLPDWAPGMTLRDCDGINLPKYPMLSYVDVIAVEDQSSLSVAPIIEIEEQPDEGWGEWDDEVKDKKVGYLEKLIGDKFVFKSGMWPGGDSTEPLKVVVVKQATKKHKKHIVERRVSTKTSSMKSAVGVSKTVQHKKIAGDCKQRRISGYLEKGKTTKGATDQWVVDELKELREKVSMLESKAARQSKKIKRLQLRRAAIFSRHLSSAGPRKRRRRESSQATEVGPEPVIRLSASESPVESASGDDSLNSAEEFRNHGGDYYGSPILTQQPPSPLHPSPEHEGVVADCTEQEEGIQEKSDQIASDHEGDVPVDIETGTTDHVKSDHDGMEVGNEAAGVQACESNEEGKSVEETKGFDYDAIGNICRSIASDQASDEETVCTDKSGLNISDQETVVQAETEHVSTPQALHGRNPDSVQTEVVQLESDPSEVVHEDTVHAGANMQTQSPSMQQLVKYSPLVYKRPLPIHWACPEPEPSLQSATNMSVDGGCSRPEAVPRTPDEVGDNGSKDGDIVYVSDSSPAKRRVRHFPSEKEDELASKLLSLQTVAAEELLPVVDKDLYALFVDALSNSVDVEHVTVGDFSFKNSFLLNLGKPQNWVTTLHMEVLVSLANRKHKEMLDIDRAVFVSPWLCNHLQGKYRSFSKAINKDLHHFDDRISDFVLAPGKKWMKEVQTVYTPMIWDDSHWVGLAINLDVGLIEILDSQPGLKDAWKVAKLVEPVTHMLPYILNKLCGLKKEQFRGLTPFAWNRIQGVYENKRSGDCGPVAMKFMELHCYGDPSGGMSTMTDALVNDLRKQYALDIYKEYVLPAYYPCNSR